MTIRLDPTRQYRHRKRDKTYDVLGRAKMQIGPETLQRICPELTNELMATRICDALERLTFVDYRSMHDDSLWVRPESEFCDGRFEEVE